MEAKTTTDLSGVGTLAEGGAGVSWAVGVMRYWNENNFEGRFKTAQTERAETILRQCGIDPATVGPKKTDGPSL